MDLQRAATRASSTSDPAFVQPISSPATRAQRSDPGEDIDSEAEKVPNSLPWLMHPLAMFFYCLMPLLAIAITEWLHQTSTKGRALFKNDSSTNHIREYIPIFFTLFVLVFTGLLYLELDYAVKAVEPFYQLSRPEGAIGSDSLSIDYPRRLLLFTPFKAMRHGHWAVVCSSLATIIDSMVLPQLVLDLFVWDENGNMGMNPTFAYLLDAALGSIFLLMAALASIIYMRRSGVPHHPDDFEALIRFTRDMRLKGSLYTLFRDSQINDEISEEELNKIIDPHRFRLKYRDPGLGEPRFDIVLHDDFQPVSQDGPFSCFKTVSSRFKQLFPWLVQVPRGWLRDIFSGLAQSPWVIKLKRFRKQRLWKDNHPMHLQTVPLSTLAILLTGLFVVVSGQPFWARYRFFTFLGSKHYVRSTISTFIYTIIWVPITKEISMMEAFYSMRREGGSSYSVLVGGYSVWPLQDLFESLRSLKGKSQRTWSDFVQSMTVCSLYTSGLFLISWNCLEASITVSIGIMVPCEVIMILTLFAIFRYRRHPILPRQPVTLISRLLYIYATDLVEDDSGHISLRESSDLSAIGSGNQVDRNAEIIASNQTLIPPSPNFGAAKISERVNKVEEKQHQLPTMPPAKSPTTEVSTPSLIQDVSFFRQLWQRIFGHQEDKSKEAKPTWLNKYRSARVPLDFIGSEQGFCAFGEFTGRDGNLHVGIGRHGVAMREYRLTPERQKHIDDGTVMSSTDLQTA